MSFRKPLSIKKFSQIVRTLCTPLPLASLIPGCVPHVHNYGGRSAVSLLLGAGIGPKLLSYTKDILETMGAPVDFQEVTVDKTKNIDMELLNTITALKRNKVALKSNLGFFAEKSMDVEIRKQLNLREFVVHVKSLPNLPNKHDDVDVVVVRQNTGAEFSMIEHGSVKGLVTSLKVITRENSERVLKFAFDYANLNKRKKVTTIHKANIVKLSDGLFLNCAREIAKKYPHIQHDDMIIDACSEILVRNPKRFDVLVCPNLYGMIITNILCGITGGPGLMSGINIGEECVIFEPAVRTLGLDITGKDVANPVAMLSAASNMLQYINYSEYASLLRDAIKHVVCDENIRTPDMGGKHNTRHIIFGIMKYVDEHRVNYD